MLITLSIKDLDLFDIPYMKIVEGFLVLQIEISKRSLLVSNMVYD